MTAGGAPQCPRLAREEFSGHSPRCPPLPREQCTGQNRPNVLLSREEFSGQNSRPRSAVSLFAERPFPALWEGARRVILGAVLGEGFPDLGPPRSCREGFRLFAGEREAARPI